MDEIIQIWMICTIQFWMKVNEFLSHPKLDVLYNPLLDDFEHAQNHPKVEVLYSPLLDDSEHAQNHPKVEVLYKPLLDDCASSNFG